MKISLNFVPNGTTYNKLELVQGMDWQQAIIWTNADPVQ